jgi:hypothetical protein
MLSQTRIAVFMEVLNVQPAAARYAAALAQRMNAGLYVLLLIDPGGDRRDTPGRVRKRPPDAARLRTEYRLAVERSLRPLIGKRVPLHVEVLLGDRTSEFLKYMASNPVFHTAVWGGAESALYHGRTRGRRPWAAGIAKELSCPFVVPRATPTSGAGTSS